MFKKAQMEFNPVAVLMGVLGMVFAWIMAGKMEATFFWRLLTTLVVGVVGFFVANFISNKD